MLKQMLKTLEGLDESFHSLYTEQGDGSFKLTGVEGITYSDDVQRLTNALNAEREAHKTTKKKYAPLAHFNMEMEDIVSILDRRDELDADKGGDFNSKLEAAVSAKLKQTTAPLERQLAEAKQALSERESEINKFRTKDRQRTISDAVRTSASKSQGFHTHAIEDALLLGNMQLDITEDGAVVHKESGLPVDAWLSDVQKSRPHWWQGSAGGGSAGGGFGGGGNPFTKAGWSLEAQGKLYKEDPAKCAALAKAAGVEIGATAPVK